MNRRLSALALSCAPIIALGQFHADVPKAWDEKALQSMTLPLAGTPSQIKYAPADWYYQIPERQIYRGYPVYLPSKEPTNYLNWLRAQPPEIAFDASKLKSESDWLLAGESVFSSPTTFGLLTPEDLHNPAVWEKFRFTADYEGSLPGWRYVIRKRGELELATTLCGSCHERVVESLTTVGPAATQLNNALHAFTLRQRFNAAPDWEKAARQVIERQFALFSVPWLNPDPAGRLSRLTGAEMLVALDTLPMGVAPTAGTSLFFPPRIPDLVGVKDRKYLGATGMHRNQGIGDLIRYSILEAGMDEYSQLGEFPPFVTLPEPRSLQRLSDAQLYALALYIYSLKPPTNPNKLDTIAKRGQKIFDREGCPACHPAPMYTNNKLTPVDGFPVPATQKGNQDVMETSVGTDPRLALETRKGTGYYKVPSLRGLWYREPFEHNGSMAMLEDWFDPVRLRDNYVPTGFKGYGVETRALKGHVFGLQLSFEERRALMAFLRTL